MRLGGGARKWSREMGQGGGGEAVRQGREVGHTGSSSIS